MFKLAHYKCKEMENSRFKFRLIHTNVHGAYQPSSAYMTCALYFNIFVLTYVKFYSFVLLKKKLYSFFSLKASVFLKH